MTLEFIVINLVVMKIDEKIVTLASVPLLNWSQIVSPSSIVTHLTSIVIRSLIGKGVSSRMEIACGSSVQPISLSKVNFEVLIQRT